MTTTGRERVVALDGGTTNTRARFLIDGRVRATARRAVGVRDTVRAGDAGPLEQAVREALLEVVQATGGIAPDRIVAAGMLSSEVGLVAVPHVPAPAGLDELARAARSCVVPGVGATPVLFVPGVRTGPADGPDGWAAVDVMRGEECEALGVLASRDEVGPMVLVLPGSHTKLLAVDVDGRITASHTTLAGELLAALACHTLLAASLPAALPDAPDEEAMEAGARLVETHGLGRAAFLVRTAALTDRFDPERRAAFLIGAVVSDDVRYLSEHAVLSSTAPVLVGGRLPQRALHARFLARRHRGRVVELDREIAENASAIGALAVARRHAELSS